MRFILLIPMLLITSPAFADAPPVTFGGKQLEGTGARHKLILDLFLSYGAGFQRSSDEAKSLGVVEKSSRSFSEQTSDSSVGIRFQQSAVVTVDYLQSMTQSEYALTSLASGSAVSTACSPRNTSPRSARAPNATCT